MKPILSQNCITLCYYMAAALTLVQHNLFIFPENGSVDYDEFCGLMKDFVVGGDAVMEVKIREAFKLFDLNSDGMITKDELSKAISKIGSKVSDEEIDNLVKIIDRDGDQKINYDGKT